MKLLLLVVLAFGCAKKPAAQTPANKQSELDKDKGSTDNSKPDDPTDAQDPKHSDDPCAGN